MNKYKGKKIAGKKVDEHRLVMEKHLGRKLKSFEVVHHIDGDKSNNKLSNLLLFPNKSAHTKYHFDNGDLKLKLGNNRKEILGGMMVCSTCKELKLLSQFQKKAQAHLGILGVCKSCMSNKRRAGIE